MCAERLIEKPSKAAIFRATKQGTDYLISSSAGIEMVVLFCLLVAVEHLAPGIDAFASISPHPYWAVILLLSVRHGTAAGLAAALVAIVLYWAHGVPLRIPDEDYYAYWLRIWREPMLWLVVALVVGEIRLSQIEDRNALAFALREAERQRTTIARHWEHLAKHVEDLERGIAVQSDTSTDSALQAVAAVRSASDLELGAAFRRATEKLLGREARTIFWRMQGRTLDGLTPDPSLSVSPDTDANPAAPAHLLVGVGGGDAAPRLLSFDRRADRSLLKGVGLLASAVIAADRSRVHGVLVVQHVDLDRMSTTARTGFSLLVAELASALDRQAVRQLEALRREEKLRGEQARRRAS